MNFVLITKLYARLRLVNINKGQLVREYFERSAKDADPPSKKSLKWIQQHSQQSFAKFDDFQVSLEVFESMQIQTIIYLCTFVIRIAADIILYISRHRKRISKWMNYVVSYGYLIHIKLFKMVYMDVCLFSTRTIFHSKDLHWHTFWAFVLILLVTYDFCEFIWIGAARTFVPLTEDVKAWLGKKNLQVFTLKKMKDMWEALRLSQSSCGIVTHKVTLSLKCTKR